MIEIPRNIGVIEIVIDQPSLMKMCLHGLCGVGEGLCQSFADDVVIKRSGILHELNGRAMGFHPALLLFLE